MKNNKVTAYLGPEGQWVKEETRFEIVPELTEAHLNQTEKLPWVEESEIWEWMQYVARNMKPRNKIIGDIAWAPMDLAGSGKIIEHANLVGVEEIWINDPSTRMSDRISFAATNTKYPESMNYPFDTLRFVINYRKDGGQVWTVGHGTSSPGLGTLTDLPGCDFDTTLADVTLSEKQKELILEWAITGEPPVEMDGQVVYILPW